jgi:hypothetical protein
VNVDEDMLQTYARAILAADPGVETLSDIQDVINEENEKAGKTVDETAAIEAVRDAENQIQLLNALKANFELVNADWIVDYADAVIDDDSKITLLSWEKSDTNVPAVTFDNIQDLIDGINIVKVEAAYGTAFGSLKLSDVNSAKDLANNYLPTIEELKENEVQPSEYALDELGILEAIIRVNNATTNNSLKNALVALDELEDALVEKYEDNVQPFTIGAFADDFDIDTVVDANLASYREALKKEDNARNKNQTKDIQTIVTNANTAATDKLLAAVVTANSKFDTNDTATEKALLDAIKAVVADDPVTFKDVDVVDSRVDLYNSNITVGEDGVLTAGDLKRALDNANKKAVAEPIIYIADFTFEPGTENDFLELLNNDELGLKNVINANKDAYFSAPLNKDGDNYFTKVGDKKANIQKVVDATNAFVNADKATTVDQMNVALNSFVAIISDSFFGVAEAPQYINLSSAAKCEVAELVLEAKEDVDWDTAYLLAGDVLRAVNARDAFLNGSEGVNTADTISKMNTALDKDAFPEFQELSASEKVAKAELVLNALKALRADDKVGEPASNFETIAEIKTAAGL